MGSKSRIAKYIIPIIQKYIDDNHVDTYIEPFVGGANVIDKINCKNKFGSDNNKYLIALLKHVKNGGKLLDEVSRDFYNDVRLDYKNGGKYNDCIIGNVGFLASYNGKFFNGGYAKPGYEKTKYGERYRDYYKESKNNLLKQSLNLKDINFFESDFRTALPPCLENAVIYCDPPYNNTEKYAKQGDFNYDDFWETMRMWSKNNCVIISELSAPKDFKCIWSKPVSRSINASKKSNAIEKLFVWDGRK
ncbi:MAG: DNA adenine methylase [Anaerostipes sp.]|uniref:DNA adenine methylase n=1 Tax=Anaerostipes sp. TaxID=1872530 RepID=UPI003993F522